MALVALWRIKEPDAPALYFFVSLGSAYWVIGSKRGSDRAASLVFTIGTCVSSSLLALSQSRGIGGNLGMLVKELLFQFLNPPTFLIEYGIKYWIVFSFTWWLSIRYMILRMSRGTRLFAG